MQPDGHTILTTEARLSSDQVEAVRAAFADWHDRLGATLIVPECDVVQVVDIDLRIPEPVGL